jgi:hypothetical protein
MVLRGALLALASVIAALLTTQAVSAEGLRIQPLMYQEKLAVSEKKKGYVDITNPGDKAVTAIFSVKAFKQVDNSGSLSFVDSEQIAAGIKLDLTTVELQPKDVLRLFFVIDGAKLPTGDVFASILAETTPQQKAGSSAVAARVGTVLVLTNGTPSSHDAEIGRLDADTVQIGDRITLVTTIKNTAPEGQATGFFPQMEVDVGPYAHKTVDGPLVFAGREREVRYQDKGNYFGPIYISAKTGNSQKGSWVFAVTGFWRWLVPVMSVLLLVGSIVACSWRRHMSASGRN